MVEFTFWGKISVSRTKTPIQFNSTTGEVIRQGKRVRNLAVVKEDGSLVDIIVKDGVLVGDVNRSFRMVTLKFLAGTSATAVFGGENYPFLPLSSKMQT